MSAPGLSQTWVTSNRRLRPALMSLRAAWRLLLRGRTILFLVRFPAPEDLKDGYYQRVKAIDACFAGYNRIYLNWQSKGVENRLLPPVLIINDRVLEIRPCAEKRLHRLLLLLLALVVGRVYAHSILRLEMELARKLFSFSRKRILDVHGVVPEEFAFHGDPVGSRVFNDIEAFAVKKATAVVCVTKRMADYLRQKHALGAGQTLIVLPILSAPEALGNGSKPFSGPSVIYCGGLHKWQQVEKMLAFVHQNAQRASFAFLVPEPSKLLDQYREKYGGPFPGTVCSAAADEVKSWYQRYSFGLVLREDVIVNNAACPTKLIEYLQNDVVPIVDSPAIGDFMHFNYAYVNCHEALPEEGQWRQMVTRNREALRRVQHLFSTGIASLQGSI